MRRQQCQQLKTEEFDLLVIGGGATGAGTALDAASRGLKVALVEADDFAAGTSSRSTKLIHGGVRYLEKAVKELDRSQYALVRDALQERATLLQIAPHLTKPIPLVTPLYKIWEVPYFLLGLKIYERLAGKANIAPLRYVDSKEALEAFPMLQSDGLRGGVIYYDGQFDDARMNVALAMTALEEGASLANHLEVTALHKEAGKLSAASVRDQLTGETWQIRAKVIVNATGPFTDSIRRMDDPDITPMMSTSSGIHIVLDSKFSPPETGLLIPETDDGRVLFLLPWLGHTLIGTTDSPAEVEANPKASEDDIAYVLEHVQRYFDMPVTRADVKASFSGLRPLVSDPAASDTAALSRDHVIHISESGLLTIAGGKWTTYRKMAEDTVDAAISLADLDAPHPCRTAQLPLVGGKRFHASQAAVLEEEYGLSAEVASYLNRAYGDRAEQVLSYADADKTLLLAGLHYLEAEVFYAAEHEMARSVVDILARRLRLGFLDRDATLQVVARVADILAQVLHWDEAQQAEQVVMARAYFL